MFTSFTASGRLLPPYICTSDKNLHIQQWETKVHIDVHPNIKGVSNTACVSWVENTKKYFKRAKLLIVDNLHGHKSEDFLHLLANLGITVAHLPSSAGKLMNPCDNSFHAAFRKAYLAMEKKPHEVKLQSIVAAYYQQSADSIKNYVAKCGYSDSTPARTIVNALISEGYRAGSGREELFEEMKGEYRAWKKNLRQDSRNLPAEDHLHINK